MEERKKERRETWGDLGDLGERRKLEGIYYITVGTLKLKGYTTLPHQQMLVNQSALFHTFVQTRYTALPYKTICEKVLNHYN